MAKNGSTIKEIAAACIKMAHEEKIIPQIIDDFKFFETAIKNNEELADLLQDPSVALPNRLESFRSTLGGKMHKYSVNAISLLIQNRLLNEYSSFISGIESSARDIGSHFECTVVTAIEIDGSQEKKVIKALEKRLNGSVRIIKIVDPSIIGGMVVKCGDWLFQSTIQSKLQQLYKHLAN